MFLLVSLFVCLFVSHSVVCEFVWESACLSVGLCLFKVFLFLSLFFCL